MSLLLTRLALVRPVRSICTLVDRTFKTQRNAGFTNSLITRHKVNFNFYQQCTFRTTPTNHLPPGLWLFLQPASKIFAIFAGRRLRMWWRNLPKDKRSAVIDLLRKKKKLILGGILAYIGMYFVFYVSNLERTPITNRIRFMAINAAKYHEISEFQFKLQLRMHGDRLLPAEHPVCRRIKRVAEHLLKANSDLKQIHDKKWSITVVDQPSIRNAFVLPNGQIFVFSGILQMCENDDQMGNILAHEMAHCVLGHGAELLSHGQLINLSAIMLIMLIWTILPTDFIAALVHFCMSKLSDLLVDLPYSRLLETEADFVGLQLAAKACFDVREAVAFWQVMGMTEKNSLEQGYYGATMPDHLDYLSTHPASQKRAEYLNSLLPDAIELRKKCNCWGLPWRNPIDRANQQIEQFKRANDLSRNVVILTVT